MKTIGIEAFLSWAYREELPKAVSEGASVGPRLSSMWNALEASSAGMLGSDGRPSDYGVLELDFVVSAPHPDAISAHEAVIGLDAWEPGFPEDWNPLADLGLSDDETVDAVQRARPRITCDVEGQARYRQRPAELVRHHAIMRSAPSWQAEQPMRGLVRVNGMPAWFRIVTETIRGIEHRREVNGFNPKARRPFPGAYRKTVLFPDPASAAIDRAEYEVWHAALCVLVEMLNAPGYLTAHQVLPPIAALRPWEAQERVSATA